MKAVLLSAQHGGFFRAASLSTRASMNFEKLLALFTPSYERKKPFFDGVGGVGLAPAAICARRQGPWVCQGLAGRAAANESSRRARL
jgi:hypothetical protein